MLPRFSLLLVAALSWEAAALRRGLLRAGAHPKEEDFCLWRTSSGSFEVWILATGMGAASAEAALDRVLRELRPGLVVSTGCAGALRPGLVAGDLLGAREVVGPSGKRLPSDCGWLERYRSAAERARVRFESGVLLSASEVLARAEQKRAARERTGCDAVDLESAAVAAQAARRGIPFAAVRAILDSEATSFPPGVADSRGHPRFGAIAAAIFRSPGLLVSFADLARAMVRCRSVLAAVHAELWRSLTET